MSRSEPPGHSLLLPEPARPRTKVLGCVGTEPADDRPTIVRVDGMDAWVATGMDTVVVGPAGRACAHGTGLVAAVTSGGER